MNIIKDYLKNNIFQYITIIYLFSMIHPISILQDICLVVAVIFLITNRKELDFKNSIVYASGLLLICFILSLLFNYDLNLNRNSRMVYFFFRMYIFYLYVYIQIKTFDDFKSFFRTTLFVGSIFLMIGLIEVFLPNTIKDFLLYFRNGDGNPFQYIDDKNIRLLSFLKNFDPNLAGFLLTVYQSVALAFALIEKSKKLSYVFFALSFFFFLGEILTGSRGAVLVGVLSLVAMLGYTLYLSKTNGKILQQSIIKRLVIVLLIILPVISSMFIFHKGGTDILLIKTTNLITQNSDQVRVELFRSAMDMVLENPLLGIGMDNYRPVLLRDPVYFEKYPTLQEPSLRDPHDLFMVIGIAGGIPAIILMLYIFYKVFHILFSKNNNPDHNLIASKILTSAVFFPFIFNVAFENALCDRSRVLLFFFVLLVFSIISKFNDDVTY